MCNERRLTGKLFERLQTEKNAISEIEFFLSHNRRGFKCK